MVDAHERICISKSLDSDMRFLAAENAIKLNPLNRVPIERLMKIPELKEIIRQENILQPALAMLTAKRWSSTGVKLSVGFFDNPSQELRKRILFHMNAWNKTANVEFFEVSNVFEGKVRISTSLAGNWSYLGTDILLIPKNQPTMNLEGFTMNVPEKEFVRVVRHEAGHTLGFPHEHMRADLIARIDRQKAIRFFMESYQWEEERVITQVLTPLEETSLLGTGRSDGHSIMCYHIPSAITIDNAPILGGQDINETDYNFAGMCYPKIH